MKTAICVGIMFLSAFLAAAAQMLLKKSADEPHRNLLSNYLNVKVICGYSIFFMTMILNVYAFTAVPYKYGSVINASSYTFALILSAVLFRDKFSWRAYCGNALIILGIAIYSLDNIITKI